MSVKRYVMSPDTNYAGPYDALEIPQSPLPSVARHGFVIGLAGWSGSGKTTLAERLITGLCERGVNVATIKHAHHQFDADVPGKDSYRHRTAGARQVLVSSAKRSVLFTEHGSAGDRPLDELLSALVPADIVIVEGFKREPIPKIEIYRTAVGKPPLSPDDEWIVATATDADNSDMIAGAPSIVLNLNDASAIVDFISSLAAARDRI